MRNLELYYQLISVRIRAQLQYRISFILEVFTAAISSLITILTLALVMQTFNNVAGWTIGQIAFLFGMVETAFGITDMVFSGFDPANFGQQVRTGSLDQLLMRPVSITLEVLGSEFILRRIGRIIQGALVLVISFQLNSIHWTPVKLVYLPVVLISLTAFFGGLYMIGATISFWTVESIEVINIFTYGGTELMAYPMNIYPDWLIRFFTFIVPAIFLNYFPALYFLDKPDPFHLPPFVSFLAPFAGFGVLLLGYLSWRIGIRHYQSTGT